MEFEMLDQETAGKTIIKVVGVGGAGGEAKVKARDQSQREGDPGFVTAGRRGGMRGGHGGSNNSSRRARTFFFSGSNLDCY